MNIILVALAACISTYVGGLVALKNQRSIRLILGWTAGVLLGVVAFEILPEISHNVASSGLNINGAMVALVVGFLLFHVVEKSILLHNAHEGEYESHSHRHVGIASALALAGHSFLDGVGIGLGFQVGNAVGIAVAIAVVAHDFSDGLNTVTLMIVNGNKKAAAMKLLLLDALAPIAGAASTLLFSPSDKWLVLYLGFFAGFLLYIGASDILPQAHSKGSSKTTISLTVLGVAFMYVVARLA
jgi:ZIP family zinc transporter